MCVYWIKLKIASFILMTTSFVILSYFFLRNPCYGKYVIVFDAGSTGTRGILYEQTEKGFIPTLKMKCEDSGIAKINGSLAPFDNTSFVKCLQGLMKEEVEPKYYAVQLRATGGMREFCRQDAKLCKSTLTEMYLTASNLGFPVTKKDFIILSGNKEALYLLRQATITFENDKSTISVIDLGGVSAQVAHEKITSSYSPNSRKKARRNSDAGINEDYAFSSDCLGTTVSAMIIERHLINTARENDGSTKIVNHPCFPTGYSYKYEHKSGFDNCEPPKLEGLPDDILFQGSFNAAKCKLLVATKAIKNECENCKKWNLTALLLHSRFHLYASGAFSKNIKSIAGTDIVPFSNYKSHVDTFCSTLPTSEDPDMQQVKYCFVMLYSVALIETAGVTTHSSVIRENQNVEWINGFVDEYISTHYHCTLYLIYLACWGVVFLLTLISFTVCCCLTLLKPRKDVKILQSSNLDAVPLYST